MVSSLFFFRSSSGKVSKSKGMFRSISKVESGPYNFSVFLKAMMGCALVPMPLRRRPMVKSSCTRSNHQLASKRMLCKTTSRTRASRRFARSGLGNGLTVFSSFI